MNRDRIFEYFPQLSERQREQITMLEPLYREWNSRINVISRKDIDQLYMHHVLHSLALYKFMREREIVPGSVADIGTGGGFPGIPLAIVMPETSFTLCDSIAKKIKVVEKVAESTGLGNVSPVWCRSEGLSGRYDYVVSRGVSALKEFVPMVEHLYSHGIIYLKGGDVEAEVEDCVKTLKMKRVQFEIVKISGWFSEEFFEEKKIVMIKRN